MRLLFAHLLLCTLVLAINSKKNSTEIEDDEEEIDWQCGTDSFTKYISENQIEIDCPELKKVVNQCCLNHDSCYDDQRGRKFCDDTFCRCLDVVTKASRLCNKEDGPLFCNLVRDFGGPAYERSGNGSTSTKEEVPLSHILESDSYINASDYDYEATVKSRSHQQSVHILDHAAKKLEAAVKEHN